LRRALHQLASHGITSFTEASASPGILWAYQTLSDAGELTARVSVALETDPEAGVAQVEQLVALRAATHGPRLTAGSAKIFADGVIESRTAAMLEPYVGPNGEPTAERGLPRYTPEALNALVEALDRAHFQVHVHAIGDRAVRMTLDAFERARARNGARDARHQIAHLELIDPADIPRFAKLGVIPSMQPYHAIDDGRWAERYIGDRIKTTYAFRSLLDAGAAVSFGSDWFVAPPTPLEGIYAAVTRRTLDDKNPNGWVPEQKITVEEAVRAYTLSAAHASFDESQKGSLAAGKLADLVMLDRNIFDVPPEEIRNVHVMLTMVGGKRVFERSTPPATPATP